MHRVTIYDVDQNLITIIDTNDASTRGIQDPTRPVNPFRYWVGSKQKKKVQ